MVFLSFIMSIFIGIQDPIIQKFTIRIAGGYISSKTGADVRIGRLYISPDFTIQLDQFLVKDLKNNDILWVEELMVKPYMEDIVHGNIHVGRVELTNAHANLITYEGEDHMNFQFLIDAFASDKEKEKSDKTTTVMVDRILLKSLDFQLWDQNKDDPEKTANGLMDFSHLALTNINLDAEGLEIIGDSINATIHHLAVMDTSGFKLNYLESQVKFYNKGILLDNLRLGTRNSALLLDLHLLYPSMTAFGSFVDSVTIEALISPSVIQVSDLGPLSQILYKMTDPIELEGKMKGTVSSFKIDNLKFALGDYTHFDGTIALQPMNLNHGKQQLNIKKLNYSINDLAAFHVPTATGTLPIPSMLESLGNGTIKGYFSGSMEKFKADLDVTSEIGNVSALLSKSAMGTRYDIYEGNISAEQLNVGKLANVSKIVGSLDLAANVTARQDRNGGMDLDFDGNVTNVMLLGNNINDIALNGNLRNNCFNGKINIADDELNLDFDGRFDFSDPKSLGGDFNMDIASADLYKLNILKNDKTALLKANITANMNNINNFNEAEGTLTIKGLNYANSNGEIAMKQFDASIINDNLLQKRINLNCDFLDFEMAGKMDFTTIGTAFKQYLYSYVTFPQWTEDIETFEKSGKTADQDFIVVLNIKDPQPITQFLMPSIEIANNTSLNGSFTSRSKSLNLSLRSKYVHINSIKIDNINCRSISSTRWFMTNLGIDQILLRDSTEKDPTVFSLDKFNIGATLANDSIKTRIGWDDLGSDDHNKASINCSFVPSLTGGRLNISQANILLFDTTWVFNPANFVELDGNNIKISNLELISHQQSLKIDGMVPMTNSDTLEVSLNKFDLSSLDFLYKGWGLDLDGAISGNATVSGLKEDLTIFADLNIHRLGLDGQTYGDAAILSKWNNENKSIDLDFGLSERKHKIIALSGSFFPERKEDNLDFKLGITNLNLGILNPFLGSFAQRVQGSCQGDIDIKGSLNQPDIQGTVSIKDGGCKINFMNTFYTFNPTITLTQDRITLNDMILKDTLGNSAMVMGNIRHNHLKDMYLDIKMYPNNFLALATNANISPSFYGTAIANGIVTAQGPTNDLRLSIKAITRKGTSMTIPIGGNSSVKKHEFITFVTHEVEKTDEEEKTEVKVEKPAKSKPSNIDIALDLSVNKEAQIKIALPNGLGNMEANGNGNIKLDMATSNNSLSLIGEYIINSGSLSLNVQDIIKRNFSLEQGSSISWTGDPVNGDIDVTGVYQTKASITSLGLIDSTSMGTSNIKVECLVHLRNKLMNPDISFGLRLPNATEDLQQAVFYVIDTTNQSELLMQVISLLLFNSFNYGSSFNGVGLLTSQVNDFIQQFTHDIDININYKPGDDLSNEEMTVDLKKQLFNDRLSIETNFGVIIPTSTYASSSTNIIGDVNVDYKITKDGRLTAQAFNRSNYSTTYYQYTYYKMVPYTQGIGISYNRNFDNFKDLFKRRTNSMNLPNRPLMERPRTAPKQTPKPTPKPTQETNSNQNQGSDESKQ